MSRPTNNWRWRRPEHLSYAEIQILYHLFSYLPVHIKLISWTLF